MKQDNDWRDLIVTRDSNGYYHKKPDGTPAYEERYRWVGKFSGDLAWVEEFDGNCFHIKTDGTPAYNDRYESVGDFEGDLAWAEDFEGRLFKINRKGQKIQRWY
jgi:hypothetical protein